MCRGPQLPGGPIYVIERVLGRPCCCLHLAHVTWRLPVSLGPPSGRWPAASRSLCRVNTWNPYNFATKVTSAKTHCAPLQNCVCSLPFRLGSPNSSFSFLEEFAAHTIAEMTQTEEEYDEAQAGDESMTGPGAPTPLAALEASLHGRCAFPGAFSNKFSWCRVLAVSPNVTSSSL